MSRLSHWMFGFGVASLFSAGLATGPVFAQTPPVEVHPDLQVDPPAYNAEVLRSIQEQARQLSETSMQALEPATLHVPDYRVAYEALQNQIAVALGNYFIELEGINQEVKVFFSKIEGLRIEGERTPMFRELLSRELRNLTPQVNQSINSRYQNALRRLYLLGGTNTVAMTGSAGGGFEGRPRSRVMENQLRERALLADARQTILRFCRTGACAMKLSEDIQAWNEFVSKMNVRIDFANFDATGFLTLGQGDSVPVVSLAMARFAERLMSGLEANKQYNVASYLGDLVQRPGGLALAILTGPAVIFEKVARFAGRLVGTRYIRIELALRPVGAYPAREINAKVDRYSDEYGESLPAVIYEEAESVSLKKRLSEAMTLEALELSSQFPFFTVNDPVADAIVAARTRFSGTYTSRKVYRSVRFDGSDAQLTAAYGDWRQRYAPGSVTFSEDRKVARFRSGNWDFTVAFGDQDGCLRLTWAGSEDSDTLCR